MTTRRRFFDVTLRVSAPADANSWLIEQEVRAMITHQSMFRLDEGDVRCSKVHAVLARKKPKRPLDRPASGP